MNDLTWMNSVSNVATAGGRRPRCHVLNRLADRCPNEASSPFGMCYRHLTDAAAEFQAVVDDFTENLAAKESTDDRRVA
jgi:hypothetical protein